VAPEEDVMFTGKSSCAWQILVKREACAVAGGHHLGGPAGGRNSDHGQGSVWMIGSAGWG
jgi:hypothetical protein